MGGPEGNPHDQYATPTLSLVGSMADTHTHGRKGRKKRNDEDESREWRGEKLGPLATLNLMR
jgi:hypothetical protein